MKFWGSEAFVSSPPLTFVSEEVVLTKLANCATDPFARKTRVDAQLLADRHQDRYKDRDRRGWFQEQEVDIDLL